MDQAAPYEPVIALYEGEANISPFRAGKLVTHLTGGPVMAVVNAKVVEGCFWLIGTRWFNSKDAPVFAHFYSFELKNVFEEEEEG